MTEQLEQLKKLSGIAGKALKRMGEVPEGRVKVVLNEGHAQYYLKRPGDEVFKYVKVSELDGVKRIVQHDYYCKMLRALEEQVKAIEVFLRRYDVKQIDGMYTGLSEGRKAFVRPILMTDEEFVEYWYKQLQGRPNGYQDERIFKTERGEMVRSKSEKIIADMLLRMGIPYVYEPCIRLDNGEEIFPDFAALNMRTRKTMLWEHLGRLGEVNYAVGNFKKLMDYEQSGCFEGVNLITTKETDKVPIDVEVTEKKILQFLT